MNEQLAYRVAQLLLLCLVVQIFVIGYVYWTDFEGRKEVVAAARRGCERDKRSRAASATGWRIAEDARRSTGDISVSNRYGNLAATLEEAASIDCTKEYPNARLIP